MSKELAFLQRAFSPPYEAGGRHIAAVFMVALLSFFMPIFVESPANIQVIVSVAWAQSANSGGQDSVPVGEEEVAPGAEQEGAQAEEQGEEEEQEDQEEEETHIIDYIHRALSGGVSNTAGSVDAFFDDERHAVEDNRTRLKLRFDVFFEKGESVDLKPRANLSLAISRTNKRLKLLVSGNPQDENEDEEGGAAPAVDEDEDLEVAVAYTPCRPYLQISAGGPVSNLVPSYLPGGLDHGGGVMPKVKYGVPALRKRSGGVPMMGLSQ
jgi:hypothetical protein